MERSKQRKEQAELRKQDELDMVPTREGKKNAPPKKHQLQDHPIFFKGSKITSQIPKQGSGNGSSLRKPSAKARTLTSGIKQVPLNVAMPSSTMPISNRAK